MSRSVVSSSLLNLSGLHRTFAGLLVSNKRERAMRYKALIIIGVLTLLVVAGFVIGAASTGETKRVKTPIEKQIEFWENYAPSSQSLSREEQKQLMVECLEDVDQLIETDSRNSNTLYLGNRGRRVVIAAAFFEYRTKGR